MYCLRYENDFLLYDSRFVFCYLYDYDNEKTSLYASQLTPLTPSGKLPMFLKMT